ncbi:MAG: DNA gyrase inhibitor YacG [Candidatus Omnitrophota bacterium]
MEAKSKKKCPQCGKIVEPKDNPFRPFCSQRCKTIDLGQWAMEKYRIPTRDESGEADTGLPHPTSPYPSTSLKAGKGEEPKK